MQQAMDLRQEVFINEQGIRKAAEMEDPRDKPSTIHFLGKHSETGKYVAVARCLLDDINCKAKFGRVAVLAEFRGKRFGAQLMYAIEAHVRDRVDMFALSSQYDRKGFYEKCGYSCMSNEIYLEEGIKHCYMVKLATKN
ncbi:unnamed protein product [Peronospora belbahrii]|uniref:N-acetyltransferase domain-containing protein n=1 Tax=Peronospora belbahrii TaxID=622444 RepID=A0AAU9KK77_9STRA|nr:unnamed protein product [Peronospora belbahrii]CAH0513382.1 unnamed protein product [Peronospora belbahrii]